MPSRTCVQLTREDFKIADLGQPQSYFLMCGLRFIKPRESNRSIAMWVRLVSLPLVTDEEIAVQKLTCSRTRDLGRGMVEFGIRSLSLQGQSSLCSASPFLLLVMFLPLRPEEPFRDRPVHCINGRLGKKVEG